MKKILFALIVFLGIVACEKEPSTEIQQVLELSVDYSEIDADGEQVATFATTLNGEDVAAIVYDAAVHKALAGKTFSTFDAGTYTFYAKYGDLTSNEVEVTVRMVLVEEEKPITLEASADVIQADGVESVTFLVSQDGADVTDASTIYVNGNEWDGDKFSTTTPGTYIIYAVKDSQTSNELTVTATEMEVEEEEKEEEEKKEGIVTVFADGVTLTSGWYDVNKVKDGSYNGDINMCWAAASSNILQWWLDRYVAAGNSIPDACPSGEGVATPYAYELAIMEAFHTHWDNALGGGWVNCGIAWFFEGNGTGLSNGAQPHADTGGYFKSVWESVLPTLYCGWNNSYTGEINGWASWGAGASFEGMERLRKFSEYVVDIIDKGVAGLVLAQNANNSGLHHSVTLWGYEIDYATNLLTKIYLTDSDDSTVWPRNPKLHEYVVTGSDSGTIKFSGDFTYYPVSLYPVSGYGSAQE